MKTDKEGFTLLELLIVIAIIGILVAMGTVSYSTAQKKARDATRRGDMKAIQNAFEQYYAANSSSYPSSCPASGGTLTIEPGNIFIIPTDPKNSGSWVYNPSGCSLITYCYCAFLEGGGGNSGVNCDFAAATKNYFCVKSLQ